MRTLTEKDRKYITFGRMQHRGKSRQKDLRIRNKIKKELEDIGFCLGELSEDQHKQVFTPETILPLFESMRKYSNKIGNVDEKGIVSNERIFRISIAISRYCLNQLGIQLINEPHKSIMIGSSRILLPQEINALATIYYTLETEKAKTNK